MDRLRDNKVAAAAALAASAGVAAYAVRRICGAARLTGGSLAKADVKTAFDEFDAAYDGKGTISAKDRSRTAQLVDKFYDLVTDIYEFGWGTSFHFSPPLPGKTAAAAEAAHEARLGAVLGVGPGDAVLDVGCGVGGPMRTVASTTGARVTGITINEYQVKRALFHNEKVRERERRADGRSVADSTARIGRMRRIGRGRCLCRRLARPRPCPPARREETVGIKPWRGGCGPQKGWRRPRIPPLYSRPSDLLDPFSCAQAGLTPLCTPVRGDFNALPFDDASFDGAYAVEATCHAASLESVYAEIFRVLKDGAAFVSYEWVATAAFDPANAGHVRIIDEINYGNGLPDMRTVAQAEAAGRAVGFVLERSVDLATAAPPIAGHWYDRLKRLRDSGAITVNRALVNSVAALRLAPPGLKPVHDMLCAVATSLVAGGEAGIFSPAHMLVFRKPAAGAAAAAAAAVAAPKSNGAATPAALA